MSAIGADPDRARRSSDAEARASRSSGRTKTTRTCSETAVRAQHATRAPSSRGAPGRLAAAPLRACRRFDAAEALDQYGRERRTAPRSRRARRHVDARPTSVWRSAVIEKKGERKLATLRGRLHTWRRTAPDRACPRRGARTAARRLRVIEPGAGSASTVRPALATDVARRAARSRAHNYDVARCRRHRLQCREARRRLRCRKARRHQRRKSAREIREARRVARHLD